MKTISATDDDFICDINAPCFQVLEPNEVELVRSSKTQVHFRKGDNLTKQGAFASYVLFVADGLARQYLDMEQRRLGERLQIDWQIDHDLFDIEVPALSLQPLAENAIYHGIEPIAKGGKITISALQIDNRLKLSISNPLMPENQASIKKKGNQMAQDNIRQRLKLVYGNQGEFTINDTKDHYTVSLLIPLDVKT